MSNIAADSAKHRLLTQLHVHLRLGRVSNLPTVWSNVLAAIVVSGAALSAANLIVALVACSALYIGGMYLNDACDADIDAAERPDRPIPSGLISRSGVYIGSVSWMLIGLLAFVGLRHVSIESPWQSLVWLIAPTCLVICIVVYNVHHKGNPFSPALMAACRALVYLSVGLTVMLKPTAALLASASLAFLWIMGLTALAKRESQSHKVATGILYHWPLALLLAPVAASLAVIHQAPFITPLLCLIIAAIVFQATRWMRSSNPSDFGRAIGLLIAGVSIVDALAIARAGSSALALVACLCAALTVLLQRRISGT